MPDSTNHYVIKKKEKPVISVKSFDSDGKNADIWIDTRDFHFSLAMPRVFLNELADKIQDYLLGAETDSREQAEEETPV